MLIIKVWGIPPHMLTNASFNDVIRTWKSQLALDVSAFKPLSITKEHIHVILALEGGIASPPERLIVEINGSTLRLATRRVSLAEIEKVVGDAISPWYRDITLCVTANFDDNA